LGARAFETIGGEVVNVALLAISAMKPVDDHRMAGLDVAEARTPTDKAERLTNRVPTPVQVVEQAGQLKNPDAIISSVEISAIVPLLSKSVTCFAGAKAGDLERFTVCYWEIPAKYLGDDWERYQLAPASYTHFSGRSWAILWEHEKGAMYSLAQSVRHLNHVAQNWLRGKPNWGKNGVVVGLMSEIPATLYSGDIYDSNCCAIVPDDHSHLVPLWCFIESGEYTRSLRIFNQALAVGSPQALIDVPFDLAHWQAVAAEKYPNGLPEPHSDDPTQWLFKGDIATSTDPLQVAVARLLGYRWPDQPKDDAVVDPLVDDDGIVCLPGVRGEAPAAERLADLLRAVGYKMEVDLAVWLRDKFFDEHCKRFHQRPFLWHIWDGRKDGFSALVNYHKLTYKALENLTYSYLSDWITAQAADAKSERPGADLRLAAAQALQAKLKLILAGEDPYDIFVRWKPLHEQAIGWHPDLNDGVRMNIRPFVMADILKKAPNIKWTKDRGKEPARSAVDYPWFNEAGDRVNDVHSTIADKMAARAKQGEKS
jgi:hypothetical protein